MHIVIPTVSSKKISLKNGLTKNQEEFKWNTKRIFNRKEGSKRSMANINPILSITI